MVQGTNARKAAVDILRRIRAGATFEPALSAATRGLEAHDRRLAHEISAGVLRNRSMLDSRLCSLISGKWEKTAPDLQDLLRIGLYQLVFLERIPTFAAVQATVEVAKSTTGKGGAGLVNAVLRRAANGDLTAEQPDPGNTPKELAEAFSHPVWLVNRWIANLGTEPTRALLSHNNRKPKLVVQPVSWSADQLRRRFTERGIEWSDAPFGEGLVVDHENVKDLPGYRDGGFIVQDSAQSRLLNHARIPDGALVWDACSSPGGKTAILSRRGPVVASELRAERMGRLRDTLSRVASSAMVLRADALNPPLANGRVEIALIDAPCSATGTLQRHPDGRWRLSEKRILEAARVQAKLLERASQVVHKGAMLVYMTCSLEPEENEELINSFLEGQSNFSRDGEDLFLFPPDAGTDGGYVARLRRIS